jgi:hypothetical protein
MTATSVVARYNLRNMAIPPGKNESGGGNIETTIVNPDEFAVAAPALADSPLLRL